MPSYVRSRIEMQQGHQPLRNVSQPWVILVDAHERAMHNFTQTVVVTASLDTAAFVVGSPAARIRLLGSVAMYPDTDGVVRFKNLAFSVWPNGTGPLRVMFSTTYITRPPSAVDVVLFGQTELFIVLKAPIIVVLVEPRVLLSPYIIAAIFTGAVLVIGGAAYLVLRVARSRAAHTTLTISAALGSDLADHSNITSETHTSSIVTTTHSISYEPAFYRFVTNAGSHDVPASDGACTHDSSPVSTRPASMLPERPAPLHFESRSASVAKATTTARYNANAALAASRMQAALRALDAKLCVVEGRTPY